MPYEYHAEVFGNATTAQADNLRALGYGAAALAGVFLLLQAAVGSWRRAGLMLVSLPLSAAGGVLTAPLAGGVWNAGSLAGLFGVVALAIRASVLLGRRIRAAEEAAVTDGRDTGEQRAVLGAAGERALPLTQSVLASAAVMLPAAVLTTRAGLEFLHPLAVTMLGGLASLLVVQAFVLPGLLLVAARRKREPVPAAPGAGQEAGVPGR
jgi:Cu/Ag efflux pump CusA